MEGGVCVAIKFSLRFQIYTEEKYFGWITDSQDLSHVSKTERKYFKHHLFGVFLCVLRSFTSNFDKIIHCEIILILSFPRKWEILAWLTISLSSLPFLRNLILILEDQMNYYHIFCSFKKSDIKFAFLTTLCFWTCNMDRSKLNSRLKSLLGNGTHYHNKVLLKHYPKQKKCDNEKVGIFGTTCCGLASPQTSFEVRSSRIHFSKWMREERTPKDVCGEANIKCISSFLENRN